MPDVRIQTRQGRDIETAVYPEEPPLKQGAYHRRYSREFPEIKLRRPPTSQYNCYSVPFACRRAWVQLESVAHVLQDDGYRKLAAGEHPMPGDIVIYRDADVIEHVGIIIENRTLGAVPVPLVLSKWGPGPEYLHPVARTPFGVAYEFWTERP